MTELPARLVPDTSVVIDGRVSKMVDETDDIPSVFISEAVVGELEAQTNAGRPSGLAGLEELQTLANLDEADRIELEYAGKSPSPSEIEGAAQGDVDALIRRLADKRNAALVTSDETQAEVARARGIEATYLEPRVESDSFAIEDFFDEGTMSVHLKSETVPKAKSGALGDIDYAPIAEEPISPEQMDEWASEIEETARGSTDGFVELSKPGMSIIQLRDYRIAIARPPFSDGIEITAVKPVAKTTLEDYRLADDLSERVVEQQRGVLIAGSPGAGKSTFAQAVGEFLNDNDVVVKTMEKPRDLQVGPDITQYTALDGDMENTADSLLLVRPDYTIYDEVRKTADFDVFADMRLAGVGMIGVVHATRAIDALQRLVGRVELGLIPQIVDTVVYIEDGDVHTVYDIRTEVKIPDGMSAEDLSRPVIQVYDHETDEPMFEMYTFNGQVVTVALNDEDGDWTASAPSASASTDGVSPEEQVTVDDIRHSVESVASGTVEVERDGPRSATVYVEDDDISRVIGQGGSQISAIEEKFGISIDVQRHSEKTSQSDNPSNLTTSSEAICHPEIGDEFVTIPAPEFVEEVVEVRANGSYLFTATVGGNGEISLKRGTEMAEKIEGAVNSGKSISLVSS